jgi:uncharacterized protein (DUF362 family)
MPHSDQPGQVALVWEEAGRWERACASALHAITDFTWLSRGDSVFIKVACNSGNKHPATTAPAAIRALVKVLQSRGAGQIWVGDQSGAQAVRLTADHRKGATHQLMKENGIWQAILDSGARPWCFDDYSFEAYTPAHGDFEHLWGNELFVADALIQVDHVVNLCRLSSHALAGYTAGLKNAVGWLRDDSRGALHRDGAVFFERIAEITAMAPLADKLRFTLTLADSAQLNIGPDVGSTYAFPGPVALAAKNILDHDSVVANLLPHFDGNQTSPWDLYAPYPRHSAFFNKQFVRITWGEEEAARYTPIVGPVDSTELARDVMRSRYAQVTGYRPRAIQIHGGGSHFPGTIKNQLARAKDGFVIL